MSFFAIDLVTSMGFENAQLLSVFVALLRTVGVTFSMVFVQRFGRRLALLISSSIVTTCCLLISANLFIDLLPKIFSDWLMIVLLLLSMFTSGMGVSVVPWVLTSEWPEMNWKVNFENKQDPINYFCRPL